LASLMYAYEDVFGSASQKTVPPADVGPSGTVILPGKA